MKRFFKNLFTGFYFLVNPKQFSKRVAEINSSISESDAISIVAKSVIKELEKFSLKHPEDQGILDKIELMKKYPVESKEDVKEMILEKQEVLKREVQYCKVCHSSYVFYCRNHSEV